MGRFCEGVALSLLDRFSASRGLTMDEQNDQYTEEYDDKLVDVSGSIKDNEMCTNT